MLDGMDVLTYQVAIIVFTTGAWFGFEKGWQYSTLGESVCWYRCETGSLFQLW